MSCGVGVSGCTTNCCIPRPLSQSNSLGFFGGKACCAYPCIEFPPHNVQICMTVNADSIVAIDTGCNVTDFVDGSSCTLKFTETPGESSWGKSCRRLSWSRDVVTGTYIRIRICKNIVNCTQSCSTTSGGGYTQITAKNSLSRFTVDGRDFVNVLESVASGTFDGERLFAAGIAPGSCLVKVACIGDTTASADPKKCCNWVENDDGTTVSYSGTGLKDLPVGFELVFGPIGEVYL